MSANDLSMCDRRRERAMALEDHVTALEAKLQAALARAERAEAEVVGLRGLLKAWWGYYGSTESVPESLDRETDSALASPSLVAEALGRVVEAVGRVKVTEDSPEDVLELLDRYIALQAARKGEG